MQGDRLAILRAIAYFLIVAGIFELLDFFYSLTQYYFSAQLMGTPDTLSSLVSQLFFGGLNVSAGIYLLSLKPASRLSALVASAVDVALFGWIALQAIEVLWDKQPYLPEVIIELVLIYIYMLIAVIIAFFACFASAFALFSLIVLLLPQTGRLFTRWTELS